VSDRTRSGYAVVIAELRPALGRRVERAQKSAEAQMESIVNLRELPAPTLKGTHSLEHALAARRSVRDYGPARLTRHELGQVLWAAQGITERAGLRTAPSAGGLYPLELYVVAGVCDLEPGIYHYRPDPHALALNATGDHRADLAAAALGQECVAHAPAIIVVAAVYARTTGTYGDRGRRYVEMEAGHAAQNVCLQATALGLGAVVVGAFDDHEVKRVARLPRREEPLALVPVGHPA
jgi:SagB-type dehydrogenase family enzyme